MLLELLSAAESSETMKLPGLGGRPLGPPPFAFANIAILLLAETNPGYY